MRAFTFSLLTAASLALLPGLSTAAVVYTSLAAPLTTPDNVGGGNADGTGVWFNVLTGSAEVRDSTFPSTLYEDGKFFLLRDVRFSQPEAEIYTQGFFSRGNGVIYASANNLNPAYFSEGVAIGVGTGLQSPGAGYPDLGPTFGNWVAGDRGFLGLTIRDPSGSSSSDIFYGFADITINDDHSISLNAFAYENVRGAAITTSFTSPVPEPSTLAFMSLGLAGLLAATRRRKGMAN